MALTSAGKVGSLRGDLSGVRDKVDFWLTRFPALYLALEQHREWLNWDKRVYLSFVRPGDVVLDVGANVGAHAVFFSHLAGTKGRVLAFEPHPANLTEMRDLVARRARFRNVTIVPVAVGAPGDEQTAVLRVPGSDPSQASLQLQSAGSWAGQSDIVSVDCVITSLDSQVRVQQIDRISFIKIDVEGAELDVLKGGAATITNHRPLIYCEVYEKWLGSFGYRPSDLMEFMRSLGYREARVITDGRVHAHEPGRRIPEAWFAQSSDVLFVLEDHAQLLRRFDRRFHVDRAGQTW